MEIPQGFEYAVVGYWAESGYFGQAEYHRSRVHLSPVPGDNNLELEGGLFAQRFLQCECVPFEDRILTKPKILMFTDRKEFFRPGCGRYIEVNQ